MTPPRAGAGSPPQAAANDAFAILAARAVVPGAPLAPSTEVRAALPLLPGWTADRRALAKEYRFADWRGTMAFANRVSELANEVDHHPDLAIGWGRCVVVWTTHDAGGVTGNDLACAARTEIIALRTGSAGG